MRSRDLKIWEDVTGRMSFPDDHRHGTALQISREEALELRKVSAGK
jgi:hypothetical protein